MYVDAKRCRHAVLKKQREGFASRCPQPVGYAIGLQGVETFEVQEGNVEFVTGRISVLHRLQICSHRSLNGSIAFKRFHNDFSQQQRGYVWGGELAG